MSVTDLENRLNRLDRLEETVFFQEKAIAELSDALRAQQTSLDTFARRLAALEARLHSLALALENNPSGGRDPELPPHYL